MTVKPTITDIVFGYTGAIGAPELVRATGAGHSWGWQDGGGGCMQYNERPLNYYLCGLGTTHLILISRVFVHLKGLSE